MIVLTSFGEDERLFAALRAGAAGYLLKDVEPRRARARDPRRPRGRRAAVARGRGARGRGDRPRRRRGTPQVDELTPRELEVLSLIARGRSNKRIALELGVAEKTVKTHVSHVLAKLGLSDRTQAALYAVREGLRQAPRVLGPIADGGARRAPARSLRRHAHRHRHRRLPRPRARALPGPRRARLAARDRRPRGRRRSRPPPRELPDATAIPGDVADPSHRRALVAAAGGAIDLLVNNASLLGPSPQPRARRLPARRARARLPRQRARAARADPARAAAPGAARRQRHLRRRRRALRGLGRLRLLEGRARAADRDPRRRAAASCASTPSTPAT